MEKRGVKRYRLINKDVLKDKDMIKKHLRDNMDAIINEKLLCILYKPYRL